jgi:hypothetical protein
MTRPVFYAIDRPFAATVQVSLHSSSTTWLRLEAVTHQTRGRRTSVAGERSMEQIVTLAVLPGGHKRRQEMKHLTSVIAILLMSGGLALAQAGGGGAAGGAGAGGAGVGAGAGGNAGAGSGSTLTPTNPSGVPNGGTVGQAPGVNPSNPQDQLNRNNPQDLSKPGASNPQDLKR